MALKIKGKASTDVQKKHKGTTILEKKDEELVGELITEGPYAEVGFTASSTVNQGNFNSVRVEVSLKMPCLVDEIDGTYEKVQSWVDQRLSSVLEMVSGE